MCPPLIGELEVEFGSKKSLRGGVAGEGKRQKRPMLEQERMFMALRGVIYMDVGGYNGKVRKSGGGQNRISGRAGIGGEIRGENF
jgi:hypothetical protein